MTTMSNEPILGGKKELEYLLDCSRRKVPISIKLKAGRITYPGVTHSSSLEKGIRPYKLILDFTLADLVHERPYVKFRTTHDELCYSNYMEIKLKEHVRSVTKEDLVGVELINYLTIDQMLKIPGSTSDIFVSEIIDDIPKFEKLLFSLNEKYGPLINPENPFKWKIHLHTEKSLLSDSVRSSRLDENHVIVFDKKEKIVRLLEYDDFELRKDFAPMPSLFRYAHKDLYRATLVSFFASIKKSKKSKKIYIDSIIHKVYDMLIGN